MELSWRVLLVIASQVVVANVLRQPAGVDPRGRDPHRADPVVVEVADLEGHLLETGPAEDWDGYVE